MIEMEEVLRFNSRSRSLYSNSNTGSLSSSLAIFKPFFLYRCVYIHSKNIAITRIDIMLNRIMTTEDVFYYIISCTSFGGSCIFCFYFIMVGAFCTNFSALNGLISGGGDRIF